MTKWYAKFLSFAAVLTVILTGLVLGAPAASAEGGPAVQWTRNADATWTLVLPAPDPWEVKDIGSTPQPPVFCGQNYGNPCVKSTFTFTSNLVKDGKACAYVQVDWAGRHNYNSDDYLNCDPVPSLPVEKCVGKDQLAHTFNAATASGSVSVKDGKKLCDPFYIKATTWTYDTPLIGVWPQTFFGANDYVLTEGSLEYQAPTTGCSQSDIYASWNKADLDKVGPGSVLTGPGAPYEPPFLHDKSSGTNPTYVNRATEGCGITKVTPVEPTVMVITKCGEYGAIAVAETEGVSYTLSPEGAQEGKVTWSASAASSKYVLEGYNGPKVFDLGTYSECPPPPVVTKCETISGPEKLFEGDINFSETRTNGSYEFTDDGLHISTTSAASSLDKVAGYVSTNKALKDVGAPTLDYTSTVGIAPGFQLAIDLDNNGIPEGFLVGEPAFYGNNWWASSSIVNNQASFPGLPHEGGGGSSVNGRLDQYLAAYPDARVLAFGFSLGSGVHGDGVLKSMTFGCVKYVFAKPVPPVKVTPVAPTVVTISGCDMYGSITLATTEGVVYHLDPEGAKEGKVTWTATVAPGNFELSGYSGPVVFDLGVYVKCTPTSTTSETTSTTSTTETSSSTSATESTSSSSSTTASSSTLPIITSTNTPQVFIPVMSGAGKPPFAYVPPVKQLSYTGSGMNISGTVGLAFVLVVIGVTMILLARRREGHAH